MFSRSALEELQSRVQELEERVLELSEQLAAMTPDQEAPVVLREIPREEAKEEIKVLFSSGGVLGYGDVVDRLHLDLQVVVSICNELEKEGVIG